MLTLKIIKARPGKNTTQKILDLIESRPKGITVREISNQLNRPISMVQICLKTLKSLKLVTSQKSQNKICLIYYPKEGYNLTK